MKKLYAHYRVKQLGTNKLYHGGGVTVYGEWDETKGELRAIGAACMPDDNYCYSIGRAIAEGRFKKYGQNPDSPPYTIGVPYVAEATTEAQAHSRLGTVAMQLARRVEKGLHKQTPTRRDLVVDRYYRSTGKFESDV